MEPKQFPFPMITPKNRREDGSDFLDYVKQFEEDHRQELMLKAKLCGVGIVHIKEHDTWRKGGMTVAFRKCNQYKSGRMVEVSVATCSPEDTFSRKIGTKMALEKFFSGERIELPLLTFFMPEDINQAVKEAFTAMRNAV
jgi:hypothetical protein